MSGAAGAAVLTGATPAMAATSLSATPSSALVNGQQMHVTFVSNDPSGVPPTATTKTLYECLPASHPPEQEDCEALGQLAPFATTGTGGAPVWGYQGNVNVKKTVLSTTCTNQCFLAVIHAGLPTTTPITFKAPK